MTPCPEDKLENTSESESGTVLITTLLIMAIMAAVAVAIMDDIRFAVKRTANVNAYAQADWYARGAQDFAQDYLSGTFPTLTPEAQNLALMQSEPVILPIERGAISLQVEDGGHCFAINSLVADNGTADDTARGQFINLLDVLSFAPSDAQILSATIIDWMDVDSQPLPGGAEDGSYLRATPPYRTANTALSSISELRALEGMDENVFQTLRPFICAGEAGVPTAFNINSARPEDAAVLAALLGGVEQAQTALQLITDRPPAGYANEAALLASPYLGGKWPTGTVSAQIIYAPRTIWTEVEITHGTAYRARVFAFDGLDTGEVRLTYRGWGREEFRPRIPSETDDAPESESRN